MLELKSRYEGRVKWLKEKYIEKPEADNILPDELKQFSDCKIFNKDFTITPEEVKGVEIVTMEGEELVLREDERKLLARGPKYCLLKSCSKEAMCCSLEVAICKHKWDTMSRSEDKSEEATLSEEEKIEAERVHQLSEELAAEAREVFDIRGKVFNMARKRVTDFKKNSRVILPRAQTAEQESKLEVLRMELLQEHKKWMTENCNCRGEQTMNLSIEEARGLKSI